MAERFCKTCRHYDLTAVLNKAGRVMGDKAARCGWQWPDIALPDSIGSHDRRLPQPRFMEPKDGATCPAWEARDG